MSMQITILQILTGVASFVRIGEGVAYMVESKAHVSEVTEKAIRIQV